MCALCKWKIFAVVVWETEPRVKRPLRRHFEMENSTVAVMLQLGGCEIVVGFKKRFIVFVTCYTGQVFFFLLGLKLGRSEYWSVLCGRAHAQTGSKMAS